jgi:hypothetical protein
VVDATVLATDATILQLKQHVEIVQAIGSSSKECVCSYVRVDFMQLLKQTNVKFVTQGAFLVQEVRLIALNVLI